MASRLIVVSNRVAVPEPGRKVAAGGLAVAVKAALKNRTGVWFGWSGQVTDEPADKPTFFEKDRVTYAVVDLSHSDFQEYYNGFANRVLWPILHYRVDLAEFSSAEMSGYERVNANFADQISKILTPDDVIWVHDYHMMPLARRLRERGHDNKIGFFLHIPMPPPELLQALPRHADIIGALADYDLVGFQTDNDRDNFGRYLALQGASVSRDGQTYDINGRLVRIATFPVSIETKSFAKTARRSVRSGFVKDVVDSLGGRKLLIGVDRLDYSKGILNRMEAFERFLREYPERRSQVTYLQITPKSRADIPEYAAMDQQVSAVAGRINGEFGEASGLPMRYLNRTYSRTALSGLYRAARVALVTPLRDGMNLVAKEFVAAQDPDDPGVLILSQFAGALGELGEGALVVNPHEPEGVARAIDTALDLPLGERQARFRHMFDIVARNDIDRWADRFLVALSETRQKTSIFGGLRAMFSL